MRWACSRRSLGAIRFRFRAPKCRSILSPSLWSAPISSRSGPRSPKGVIHQFGAPEAIAASGAEAEARGAKATPLAIRIPSHTSLMAPAVEPFRAQLAAVDWKRPSSPVLAGVSGAPIFAPGPAQEALAVQLAQTIDWAACLDGLRERGCTVLLELGPGAGLARMARDRFPDLPSRSVAEFQSLEGIARWAAAALAD